MLDSISLPRTSDFQRAPHVQPLQSYTDMQDIGAGKFATVHRFEVFALYTDFFCGQHFFCQPALKFKRCIVDSFLHHRARHTESGTLVALKKVQVSAHEWDQCCPYGTMAIQIVRFCCLSRNRTHSPAQRAGRSDRRHHFAGMLCFVVLPNPSQRSSAARRQRLQRLLHTRWTHRGRMR